MPTWNEISAEIEAHPSERAADEVRAKYLGTLEAHTGRPVIAYYSGYLSKQDKDGRNHPQCSINDLDMNGFMAVIHGLPRDIGIDLFLHTPGGYIEAARGIVEYLYKMFGHDIRAIVPQLAMSAGTMIACATKEIVLAKHSCLGPTDPQIRGFPAMGVLAEIDRAFEEIKSDQSRALLWQQVFSKYPPAFINDCERSVANAKVMVSGWLKGNMLSDETDPSLAAQNVVQGLMDYSNTSDHGHHFLRDKCKEIGLNISALEDEQLFQEHVLSVHHAFMASFHHTDAIKIIDNSRYGTWSVAG